MRLILLFCLLLLPFTSIADIAACYYVNAPNGLNIRSESSINAKTIGRLAHGDVILDFTWTQVKDTFISKGDTLEGTWVRIDFKGDTGYVFDRFIVQFRTKLLDSTLYNFNSLFLKDFSISYDFNQANDRCDIRVLSPGVYPTVTYKDTTIDNFYDPNSSVLDTLKSIVKFELVDFNNYKHKVLKNKYEPDYSPIQKYIYSNNSKDGPFYLPIANNSDTVEFHDIESEVLTSVYYIGRIPILHWYLIKFCYEECGIGLFSEKDGKRVSYKGSDNFIYSGAGGVPQISPNAKYMVDYTLGYYEDCNLTISKLQGTDSAEQILRVNLRSWIPDMYHNEVFWLSDKELILRVLPIDLYISKEDNYWGVYSGTIPDKEITYQYIKLTIL